MAHANEIASGSLLAVILALMVFLIVAMIGMVVVRTRGIDLHAEWCRLRSKMSSPKGGIVRSFVRSRKAFKSRIAKGSSSSKPSKLPSKGVAVVQSPYCRPSSNGSSRPVGKVDFAKHMMLMSADSDFLFSEEFELLKPVGRTLSMAAADLPCNRIKNRFTNILPYDYSRVKLSPVDDDEGSDYINANYISGYNNPREYIATQGPMPSTRDDFWRMVWEQQCVAIVNLTRCVEKGREKCDQYWPLDAKTMLYGDVEVVVLNESRLPYWTIREFLLQKGGGIQRRVKNFHFTAWPDFGVPDQPKVVIDFVRLFRAQVNSVAHKPVVVHCSAGVGRSGTFIALDQLLQSVRSADIIDVFGTVYQMRKERVWMVQSEVLMERANLSTHCQLNNENLFSNSTFSFTIVCLLQLKKARNVDKRSRTVLSCNRSVRMKFIRIQPSTMTTTTMTRVLLSRVFDLIPVFHQQRNQQQQHKPVPFHLLLSHPSPARTCFC